MNKLLLQFVCLAPSLVVAFSYGRMTGDMKTSLTVIALLVGIWAGLTFSRLSRAAPDQGA